MASNLTQRVASAAVLAPIVLYLTYLGGLFFTIMVSVLCILMMLEWYNLTRLSKKPLIWAAVGLFYVILPCVFLADMRDMYGYPIIFSLIAGVWGTDTFAYVGGKSIGGKKLAPKISPNKTVSGTICGVLAGAISFYVVYNLLKPEDHSSAPVGLAILLSLSVIVGDLFESWIKRRFDVKDSGQLIPGHGGVLDRMDGLLAATLVTAAFTKVLY